MNYFVTKKSNRLECRIYLDQVEVDSPIIYKGHKLGIESKHLLEFLEYRQEKSTGRVYFLNYEKWDGTLDHKNADIWISGSEKNLGPVVTESWNTLKNRLKKTNPDFKRIVVTKVVI